MKWFFWALVACGMFVSNAPAVVLLQDNFDTYDQASFVAAWPRYNCTAGNVACTGGPHTGDATLVTDKFVSSPNSVFIPTGSDAANSKRHQHSFAQTGLGLTDKLVFSFDMYDAITGNPQRNFANLHDQFTDANAEIGPSGTNQLISMGLFNNLSSGASGGDYYMARILGYSPVSDQVDPDGGPAETGISGTSQFFKLNDFGTSPLRSVGWHNFRVELTRNPNGTGTDYNFFVDGFHAETVSNIGAAASLRNYDTVVIGTGVTNTVSTSNFDNILVELNPPAAIIGDGDFNGDLVVDAADYVLWRNNEGLATGATKDLGDADVDGDVDGTDYGIWKGTFGKTITPPAAGGAALSTAAIPEPATLTLVLLTAGLIAAGRRR
jgi:PEP-CTERM motif